MQRALRRRGRRGRRALFEFSSAERGPHIDTREQPMGRPKNASGIRVRRPPGSGDRPRPRPPGIRPTHGPRPSASGPGRGPGPWAPAAAPASGPRAWCPGPEPWPQAPSSGLWSLGPRPRGPGSRLPTPGPGHQLGGFWFEITFVLRQEARPLPAGSCGCGAVVAAPWWRRRGGARNPGPEARGPGPDDNQWISMHRTNSGRSNRSQCYLVRTGLQDLLAKCRAYAGHVKHSKYRAYLFLILGDWKRG